MLVLVTEAEIAEASNLHFFAIYPTLHATRLGVCKPCDKRSEGTCYPELQGSMYGLGETYIQITFHMVLKSVQGYKKKPSLLIT